MRAAHHTETQRVSILDSADTVLGRTRSTKDPVPRPDQTDRPSEALELCFIGWLEDRGHVTS